MIKKIELTEDIFQPIEEKLEVFKNKINEVIEKLNEETKTK